MVMTVLKTQSLYAQTVIEKFTLVYKPQTIQIKLLDTYKIHLTLIEALV